MHKPINIEHKYCSYFFSPTGMIELISNNDFLLELNFVDEKRFPIKSNPLLENASEQLKEYFSHNRIEFAIPMAPHGTDFQKRVWNELLKIPFGKTITYYNLAQRLGNAKVIRAAANANGKNPIAIIIACHRVIGMDGSLTGYAGGIHRKKWLLDFETGVLGLGFDV